MGTSSLVFAGAPYSNSAPLIDRLVDVDASIEVCHDHPSQMVQALMGGEVDVALLPVVDLFRHTELSMIEGFGVVADGPIRSVLLKCDAPVGAIRRVLRDPASSTSNALAFLVLREQLGREVELVDAGDADARVLIGDRALCSSEAPYGDIDLAQAWTQMSGLPFVFAVWAVRNDFAYRPLVAEIVEKACMLGCASLEQIAKRYVAGAEHDVDFWYEYLKLIRYRIAERELAGLNHFRELVKTIPGLLGAKGI